MFLLAALRWPQSFALVVLLSLAILWAWPAAFGNAWAYHAQAPNHAPYFMIGMVFAMLRDRKYRITSRRFWLGLAVFSASFIAFQSIVSHWPPIVIGMNQDCPQRHHDLRHRIVLLL